MANEFIARKGLISRDNVIITGSLVISGSLNTNGQISGSSVRAAHHSSNGTAGINQNVTFVDATGDTHDFTFTDGLLTAYSKTL
jgi:hypothetical protein